MSLYQEQLLQEVTRKAHKVRDLIDALDLLYICDPYRAQQYDAIGLSNMSQRTAHNMIKEAQKYGFQS